MDEEALKVLYRLHHHGYLSYLVGGSVRDLLLGRTPKDFDVATNAHPHEIHDLFRNSRIIGRRFRLVQVFFKGRKIVEVSTFRSRSEFEEIETEDGTVMRTDSFGTPEEDAFRRDITINGLFYNIADFSVIDYVDGMADLQKGIVRSIGDPDEKFTQDPVRMFRVLRHTARTGFSIDPETYHAVIRYRDEIRKCSPSRLRDEFLRELKEGVARPSLDLMLQTGLLLSLFPDLERVFGDRNPHREKDKQHFLSAFGIVDRLLHLGRPVSDAVLFALFAAPFLRLTTAEHPTLGEKERHLYRVQAIRWGIEQLSTPFSIQRAIKEAAAQILVAQAVLGKAVQYGMVPRRLRTKGYFQEALLFYGIEAEARGEKVPRVLRTAGPSDLLPWWPKEFKRRHRRPSRRSRLFHQQDIREPENLREEAQQGFADKKTD